MSFSSALYDQLGEGRTVWVVLAWVVVLALARFAPFAARLRLRTPSLLLALHLVCVLVVAGTVAAGYDPTVAAVAGLAFELLSIIGLAQVLIFWIALPRVGLNMPRILIDVITAIASLVAMIAVGKRAGFSVAGLITTSAVLTAVIGFAMQDTLGNLMGGLALQMDSSIKVGDWITLGPGQPAGRVVEIRWRYTAIETRNWETIILPNSMLMKGQVVVLGRQRERCPQEAANRRLVFDDEHQRGILTHDAHAGSAGSSAETWGGTPMIGSENQNRAPPPDRFSAWIAPPCASRIARQIARPSPAPRRSPVTDAGPR